ncbi:hypothetical protein M432DRAFT_528486, partial [Thermoascus aurantiacus ATCC 26904]
PGRRYRYRAFQKECQNAVLIDLISSAIRQSDEPIYLDPRPATREDARQNLRAFSTEGRRENRFQNVPDAATIPISSLPENKCLGWMTVKGNMMRRAIRHLGPTLCSHGFQSRARFDPRLEYYAIVYTYIPPDEFALSVAQSQLDFYYLDGFSLAGWKLENW